MVFNLGIRVNLIFMEYKNRTVNVFGVKYTLKYVKKIQQEQKDCYIVGVCNSSKNLIEIATHDIDGKPIKEDYIKTTVLHELIHAILNEGQYSNASSDEPLVELLAKCLFNIIFKQKI